MSISYAPSLELVSVTCGHITNELSGFGPHVCILSYYCPRFTDKERREVVGVMMTLQVSQQ